MVDFDLTDEQLLMREMAHDFAEKEIRPRAWEYDRDGTWPEDILEKAREVGLVNSHVPSESGGAGASYPHAKRCSRVGRAAAFGPVGSLRPRTRPTYRRRCRGWR